jgi:virginiamycin A acetyltransferase
MALADVIRRTRRRLRLLFYGQDYPRFLCEVQRLKKYDIGAWTRGYLRVRSWSDSKHLVLRIGRYCTLARGTTIVLGGEHRIDWVTTYGFEKMEQKNGANPLDGNVIVGNDVWIAENSLILSGVTIGDGAVIGAGSVVRRDVPPYGIVAGNPARVIRFRFEKDTIQALQNIAWWNWPHEKVEEALPLLCSGNIEDFVEKYG